MPAKILIVSDIDNTLLGGSSATERFTEWMAAHADLVRLAYASGRFFPSVAESIEAAKLPLPDAVISGVGTEIAFYPEGDALSEWSVEQRHYWDPQEVRRRLARVPELTLQPAEFQSELKISYFLHDAAPEQLAAVAEALRDPWLRVETIYSSRRDLDIVPAGVNKGSAAAFLASLWNFTPERVIVCGDSGNDLPMFGRGFRGVIVANAHDDLKAAASAHNFLAPSSFAAGVVEGLEHWKQTLGFARPENCQGATLAVA